MTNQERARRDRNLYNDLTQLFPPPPYLIQREIRPWLYQEVCRLFREKRKYSWFIYQMERLNWEKE